MYGTFYKASQFWKICIHVWEVTSLYTFEMQVLYYVILCYFISYFVYATILVSRNVYFYLDLLGIYIFFYLGFLSQTFTIHRTTGEGGGYFCYSSLSASQTLRHYLGNYCREITPTHS